MFRLATFNLENLDSDRPRGGPTLEERIAVLRPQLQRLRADILCLQEVNAQKPDAKAPRVLTALDKLLDGTPYAAMNRHATGLEEKPGPADKHNLVILTRFEIAAAEQLRHQFVAAPTYNMATGDGAGPTAVEWDRPVQHCLLRLDGGETLHLFNLHLRAPIATPIPGQKLEAFTWKSVGGWAEGFYLSSMKRAGQALETRLAVERIFDADPDALIAVCGDFNAEDHEVPTRIIRGDEEDTGNGALAGRSLIVAEHSLPEDRRFSVVHHGRRQMLDHLLISRCLLGWYREIEVHNEDLGDELVAYEGVRRPPDSYHAPVVATFEPPA